MSRIKTLTCSLLLWAGLHATAQAQGVIDMSKFTCEQMLSADANAIEAAVWLSGYYNGLRKNTKLDLAQVKKNADTVVAECKAKPKSTVMQIADKLRKK
jgi:hypothetical protein